MANYSVYMHINKLNNKKYIGITSMRPKTRWKNGCGYKKQRRFYSAIKSYGWNNFEHIVLESGLSKEEAEHKEEQLIKQYKSNCLECGYNIENGGVTNKISEEQKAYLSKINIGKKHTEATKEKMKKIHSQIGAPWMNGKKHSEETKIKMGNSRKGIRNGRAKEVYQYDLNGNFIMKYDYMQLAGNALGVNTAHISQCCANKRHIAYGYMWSYELEHKEPYQFHRKEG